MSRKQTGPNQPQHIFVVFKLRFLLLGYVSNKFSHLGGQCAYFSDFRALEATHKRTLLKLTKLLLLLRDLSKNLVAVDRPPVSVAPSDGHGVVPSDADADRLDVFRHRGGLLPRQRLPRGRVSRSQLWVVWGKAGAGADRTLGVRIPATRARVCRHTGRCKEGWTCAHWCTAFHSRMEKMEGRGGLAQKIASFSSPGSHGKDVNIWRELGTSLWYPFPGKTTRPPQRGG